MRKYDQNQYDQWHDDPENWVWGLFYYNTNDDRIWLPKRVKAFGYTVNFDHPMTGLLFVAAFAVLLFLSKLSN